MCTRRSAPLSVKRGVPQGSVLGPVLFVLFTSDFQKHLETYCYSVMYADDTVLVTSHNSAEELEINTYISIGMAEQYCSNNDLVFNTAKTKYITMGKKKDQLSELPNLTKVEEVKHLGMTIDNRLSWNDHVDQLCARLSSAIFALKRIKLISTTAATKTAYHAIFETHLRYGIILWGSSSAQNLQRVLVLQKHAVRIMAGLSFPDTCRDAFRILNILTVTSIYIIDAIVYASKQTLQTHREIHSYNTRHADNLHLPAHRTTLFTKKPSFAGAKLMNMLPHHLRNASPNTLKRKLQDWLLDYSVYTLEEFRDIC
uniref:Reverse transcriptase domain-containing protein n=1 Tax=Cuerna arida TaxID=1464854 RepID=A0A1B6GBB2_9HEMI